MGQSTAVMDTSTTLTPWQERLAELALPPREPEPPPASRSVPPNPSTPPPPEPETDVAQEVEELLRRARETAEEILAQAEARAIEIERDTREHAMQAVAREQQAALESAVSLLREGLTREFRQHLRQLEVDATRLCVVLGEKIVRRHIPGDDETVVQTVREGLDQLAGAGAVTIHVHPDCAEALREARGRLAGHGALPESITISPDDRIEAGGAVLTGSGGEVDLQIGTQLRALESAVETALDANLTAGADI
jgi:flagellar assembly protein FliH